MKIAVCITTKDRYDIFSETYSNVKLHLPDDAYIFVVDDGSKLPVIEADIRNETSRGIAAAKNQCLSLAYDSGAEHIFLLDDDVRLLDKRWVIPYVESKEPHLAYNFLSFKSHSRHVKSLNDTEEIYRDSKIVAYTHSRGCLLYVHRSVLDVVGGFDESFGKCMDEHQAYSNRIYNAGLTSFRYMDVIGSDKLIHSMDEWQEVVSSIPRSDRTLGLQANRQRYEESLTSSMYCEFREKSKVKPSGKNVVLTSYLNGHIDVQRGREWEANFLELGDLYCSVEDRGIEIVCLSNCFGEAGWLVKAESNINPYFQRWLNQYQYLRDHPEIDKVFCVDATDVQMLHDPFPHIQDGKLYVGDENSVLGSRWMIEHANHSPVNQFVTQNRRTQLLNCGVVGGSRELVMNLCRDMIGMYFDSGQKATVDMPIFNYLCYTKYNVEHGRHITNVFKSYDTTGDSWWAHK